MALSQSRGSFSLCVEDGGSEDLQSRKIYRVLADRNAEREGFIRIVDESGEDYLYPTESFVPIRLPAAILRRLGSAARVQHRTTQPNASKRRTLRRA